jgi:hypothetical protein
MQITRQELLEKVKQAVIKLNDVNFINHVISHQPATFTNMFWSKNMGYSLVPFGLEMMGVKGSKYLRKRPLMFTYLYQYNLINDDITQVIEHTKSGTPNNIQYIYKDGYSTIGLKVDSHNIGISLTEVISDNGGCVSALRVDNYNRFWYNEYVYVDGKVKHILCDAYNCSTDTLELEYVDNTVSRIYVVNNGITRNFYEI